MQKVVSQNIKSINIPINLPRHNHHPKIENRINKLKRKGSFPAIAYKTSQSPIYNLGKDLEDKDSHMVLCVNQAKVLILFPQALLSST